MNSHTTTRNGPDMRRSFAGALAALLLGVCSTTSAAPILTDPLVAAMPAYDLPINASIADETISLLKQTFTVGSADSTTPAVTSPATVSTPSVPAVALRLSTDGAEVHSAIAMAVNRSRVIRSNSPLSRISVAQPDVADVNTISADSFLVTAKQAGQTQLIVWDDSNRSTTFDVNVLLDTGAIESQIRTAVPGSSITATAVGNSILLRGQAPNLTAARKAEDIAKAFGTVINHIEVGGGQQVTIKVQFAEVARSVTTQLGVSWGFNDGVSVFGNQTGADALGISGNSLAFPSEVGSIGANFFGLGRVGASAFSYFIRALQDNNLLRTLAEPNLTVMSGEEASFVAGGQLPVPVPDENGITIEYKDFGIQLRCTPVVLGDGRIRLKLSPEASEVDFSVATTIAGGRVPGFRTRRVDTTVELVEGQTLAIAGLLDNKVAAQLREVPGLGKLPVLGQLFRSTRYQRDETELVVLVTPVLSAGMNPNQVPTLPGANWRHPSVIEQATFGDIGGDAVVDAMRPKANANNGPAVSATTEESAPLFIGTYGFAPVTPEPDVAPTLTKVDD